ncbi:MAG TPA: hypothetical protein VLU25_04435 [Acidobacteriota bacterium]|nr:hypothetical protein [Acidobacteriota bacterium]
MASAGEGSSARGSSRHLTIFLIVINALLILPFGYCVVVYPTQPPPAAERFQQALDDAMSPGAGNAATGLVALTPGNSSLFWDRSDPQALKVLVAVWTDYSGYRDHFKGGCTLRREVWVTPVPQMQEACRGFGLSGAELNRRLEEYMGLAAGGTYSEVVELWVSPDHVFRPCPDGEIDDAQCNPGLPEVPSNPSADQLEHARWFQRQVEKYYGERPLPWTRFGYTYDWADPAAKIGASEYIIRKDAAVFVSSVTPTGGYCSTQTTLSRSPAPAGTAFTAPC